MVRPPLTIDEQIADMRRWWPRMRAYDIDRKRESAVGWDQFNRSSAPTGSNFAIGCGATPRYAFCRRACAAAGQSGGCPASVYPPIDDPTLCLFDPAAYEWDPHLRIAETILPWSIKWLACYEFWLMTGRWVGGGRHADLLPRSLSGLSQ